MQRTWMHGGRSMIWVVVLLSCIPRAMGAHAGRPPEPHDLATAWTLDPLVLSALALPTWAYWHGVRRVWSRAGRGRGVTWRQVCAFGAGIVTLVVALVSPVDALGSALFSAHMSQHQLLMVVAAPLLVMGAPQTGVLWGLASGGRRTVGRWGRRIARGTAWRTITHPAIAWALHAAAIWLWHAPPLYERTLSSEVVHATQHAFFFVTALIFWWTVVHPAAARRRSFGVSVLSVFTTAVHGSILGALLTFSATPWYPVYAGRVEPWGLTLLEDQQLGGLIMWVPTGIVYTGAALLLFTAWLREMERRSADWPAAFATRPSPVAGTPAAATGKRSVGGAVGDPRVAATADGP